MKLSGSRCSKAVGMRESLHPETPSEIRMAQRAFGIDPRECACEKRCVGDSPALSNCEKRQRNHQAPLAPLFVRVRARCRERWETKQDLKTDRAFERCRRSKSSA